MSISVVSSGLEHNTGTTTAPTITLTANPSAPQPGDIIIAQIMERNGSTIASHGSSSGYTSRGPKVDQGTTQGTTRWTKLLTTGETTGTVHTFTCSSAAAQRSIGWIVLRSSRGPFTDADAVFAGRSSPWAGTTANTTLTWAGVTVSGVELATLVGFANTAATNLTGGIPNPAGTTEVQETQSGSAAASWRRMSIWYQHNVAPGVVADKSATIAVASSNQGGMIAISDLPAPTNLPLGPGVDSDETAPLGILLPVPGSVSLPLASLNTDEASGAVAAVAGTATLSLTGLAGEETIGTLTATPGTNTLPLTGPASDESTGTLTAVPQATTRPLTGLSGDEGAGTLVAVPQALTRPLTGLSSDETAPPGRLTTVPGTATRLLAGLTTDELAGTLSVTQPAANTIPLQGVGGDELAGSLLAVAQARSLSLAGIFSDEATGVLTAAPQGVAVQLAGLATDELAGALTPTQIPPNNVPLIGAATDEAAGSLFVAPGTVSLQLAGLGTDELAGTLTPVGEGPPVTVLPLTGVSTDELAYTSLLELPQPATVQLVGLQSDERPGRPYTPELGTPPPPRVLVGIRESPRATVGVRDPPRLVSMGAEQTNSAITAVRERRGARLRVLETPRANVRGIEEKT